MNAYTRQISGTHYLNMGMQPFRFAMRNGWDNGSFSILKYVSRHRSKKGLEDIRKARHFVELREEELIYTFRGTHQIPMTTYIAANGITGKDAETLLALEGWVEGRLPETTLIRHIDDLIREYEGEQEQLSLPSP